MDQEQKNQLAFIKNFILSILELEDNLFKLFKHLISSSSSAHTKIALKPNYSQNEFNQNQLLTNNELYQIEHLT